MRFHPPSRGITASLIATATLSLSAIASAQNQFPVYSENFNSGYTVNNSTLSDQRGWTTNDEDTGSTYTYNTNQIGSIGQSDFVGYVGTFSQQTSNYAGAVGGVYGQSVVPGIGAGATAATPTAVTVNQSLPTLTGGSVVFGADFQITQPSVGLPSHDTFGLALTSAAVANGLTGSTTVTPAISINFTPDTAGDLTFDNAVYTAGTTTNGATGYGINLGTNTRYRLTITVNVTAGTFSATLQSENANGSLMSGTLVPLVSGGTYNGTAITGYAATWALQNNTTGTANSLSANDVPHIDAGSNVLYFDNVLVTVPEPSTYAMVGLGALGLVMVVRRSRRLRVA